MHEARTHDPDSATAARPAPLPDYVDEDALVQRLGEEGVRRLQSRYLSRDDGGRLCESPGRRFYTVARAVAEVERSYGADEQGVCDRTRQFYELLSSLDFLPAGRILANVASSVPSLFNCYVLPVPDDLAGIYEQVRNAAIIHKNGGGTGYNFSQLRPRGTYVKSSRGVASGPVSFIEQFDKETEIINSGNRRGANMGVLNVNHPDILDFIHAKQTEGKLANFNVSIGMTDRFMQAAADKAMTDLEFPRGTPFSAEALQTLCESIDANIGGAEIGASPRPPSLRIDGAIVRDTYENEPMGAISNAGIVQIDAGRLLRRICSLTHQSGDPGMVFLDAVERDNPLPSAGPIEATNPCGEQPLHPYDACNLGSVNLARHVKTPPADVSVDWEKLARTTRLAIRFLDNCNDINRGPIPEVEETVRRHRRVGLGVMGWADLLGTLAVPYDSQQALDLAEELMEVVTATARAGSVELADEKGPCPALRDLANEGHARLPRNLQATTIAPTGTISMVAGCNGGIEPYFALSYTKHIRGGEQTELVAAPLLRALQQRGVETAPVIEAVRRNGGSLQGVDGAPHDLCRAFPTAREISPEWHVRMQAAFQKHTDNAVSKTINLPNQSRPEDVERAFFLAWKLGCKGVTAYRDGSRAVQVLEAPLPGRSDARACARATADASPTDVCEFRRAPAGEAAPNGAAVPGPFQFRCPECEGTDYHVEAGCPDAVCNACGWRRGNCG